MVKTKKKKHRQNVAPVVAPVNVPDMDVQQEKPWLLEISGDYKRVLCSKCGARPVVYKTINYTKEVTKRGLRCDCGWRAIHVEDRGKGAM